jgi:hypothetical protein
MFRVVDRLFGFEDLLSRLEMAAWRHIPEDYNLIITIDLKEEGCEGVALANVFPMANSGDTEMNQKMGKAEVL